MFIVPSDIQARGPEATEAYNNALMEGKAFLKRVPIMIIGQARTGKTSLKKSLRGEKFDPKEQITEGIETDPSYFKVSTEIWRAGENDNNKTDPGSEDFFEQNIAQSIFGALKNVKISQSPPLRKPGNDNSDTPITDSILSQRNSHSFEEEIPESIATRVEKLLQNNEDVEEEEEIFSILWDFGGQSVYYATHPIFLTEKAIYILACDLSRNPHDKADTLVRKGLYRNKEDICNKTNLDYLDFWLSSVYSLVGPDTIGQDTSPSDTTTARLPPVFFVCTHADEPYCSTTDPRDLAVDIYGFLRSKPYKSHLFKDVFVVDNTKSGSRNGCPEVTRLREKLLSVAQGLPQLKEAIPLKWLKFENILRLLREDNCKLMAIGEARQIATDKCGIEHDEQFRTMLDFLHDQKVLIHFNETQLNNLVILDPQWLIDIFKKVITIRRYEYTEDNVERFWLKLQETGILDERLLDHEWKHLIDKYSKETCGSLIAIMERFSLLCPWPSDGENIQYLVPSMLMSPPTNDVLELLASVRTPSLFVRFEVGRVPPGLFTRLVLQFYQWCHEEWKSQKQPELFRNFAQFHILPDEGTSAIIMCHSSSIEIIIHDGNSISEAMLTDVTGYNPGLTTSRKIHWQLRLILECMRREFSWLKNMKYEMCICCPVCSQKGSPKCRSHDVRGCECLHLLSESELLQCQYCTQPGLRGDCRICIKMFAPWFSFSGPKEGRTPVNQVGFYLCTSVYNLYSWNTTTTTKAISQFTILDIRNESISYSRLGKKHKSCLRDLS